MKALVLTQSGRPHIDSTLSLEQFDTAYAWLESRQATAPYFFASEPSARPLQESRHAPFER